MNGITIQDGYHWTDDNIVKLAKSGDKVAFTELINFNRQALYRVAKGILESDFDAADAIQEAIISAYKNIGSLKKDEYFKTWIIRILINECRKILRHSKRAGSIQEMREHASLDYYPSDSTTSGFINMLEQDLRYVIVLYYYEDFNIKEIAKILRIPQGTVKSRLKRARNKLMELMKKNGDEINGK